MKLFDNFFSKKSNAPADLTTITRTDVIEGFSIPGVIKNMDYFFTDIQIYSDGLISCWEMVDLQIFKHKLDTNWVVTSIPNGKTISMHSLGSWTIDNGKWIHTRESYYDYVLSIIKKLNPRLENLHNYNGDNFKEAGKSRVAKHFIPDGKPYYYKDPNDFLPRKINGERLHIFYRDIASTTTYLAELSLFKDGHIEISNIPERKIFQFDSLRDRMTKGELTTQLKVGELVTVLGLGSFTIRSGDGLDVESKYQEIEEVYKELCGEETAIKKCRRIFEEYKQAPSKKLRQELKDAYEAVPKDQQMYVGTMDTQDYEVRLVIYGDRVKKEFEDDHGFEYPYGDALQPKDA
jgi:hypothetical protein